MGNGNLLILRSSQSHAIGKKKMTNNEMSSNDISARLDICSMEPS